jgi:Icc-related predicted phosphoesterase
MLKIQVASDLHLELHADGGRGFIQGLDSSGVDVLVLAGDIMSARFFTQVKDLFARLADKYAQVFYVPGNHELWLSRPEEAMTLLGNAVTSFSNVAMLNNQVINFNGRRFIGGPMWFPQWSPLNDYASTQMPDFDQIVDFAPWVVAENRKFQKFMQANLKINDIVLTHYLPSYKSVAPKYQGAATNAFFVCEMDQLIHEKKPALWIHGHTHESFDYQLSSTRIVCNPFGYPKMLNHNYKEKLLISVD